MGTKTTKDTCAHFDKTITPLVACFSGGESADATERINARSFQIAALKKANQDDREQRKRCSQKNREDAKATRDAKKKAPPDTANPGETNEVAEAEEARAAVETNLLSSSSQAAVAHSDQPHGVVSDEAPAEMDEVDINVPGKHVKVPPVNAKDRIAPSRQATQMQSNERRPGRSSATEGRQQRGHRFQARRRRCRVVHRPHS